MRIKAFSPKGYRFSSGSISASSLWRQTRLNTHRCQKEALQEQFAKLHYDARETESPFIPHFISREPLRIPEFTTLSQLSFGGGTEILFSQS